MDEEIERLVIAVRADTAGFARDVAQMRGELGGGLGEGAERAGRLIEGSLLRAIRGGRTGFDELRTAALRALDDIAGAALRGGVRSLLGGVGLGGGGLGSALAGLLGAPGRATGGPVTAGRAYMVGERFTVADIAVAAAAHRWLHLDVPRIERPALRAWYARVRERPAASVALPPLS